MIANKQGILTLPDFTTQVNKHLFRAENVHSGRSMNKLRYIPRTGWTSKCQTVENLSENTGDPNRQNDGFPSESLKEKGSFR